MGVFSLLLKIRLKETKVEEAGVMQKHDLFCRNLLLYKLILLYLNITFVLRNGMDLLKLTLVLIASCMSFRGSGWGS